MTKSKTINFLLDFGIILAGSAIYASAIIFFIKPFDIPMGGLSGIALVINYTTGFPIGTGFLIMNIPLFLISWKVLGKSFLVKTLFATVISSLLIDIFVGVIPRFFSDVEPMLACLYGGLLTGLGIGLIFSRGATAGGSDILTKIINRKFSHLSIGKINMVINIFVILISAFVFQKLEAILFAFILQFVSGYVIDAFLSGIDNASAALIVTSYPEEVSNAIIKELNRGVTAIEGTGMYTKELRYTLLCAFRTHEITALKRTVFSIDADAFVILTNTKEVAGRGFKSVGH